MAPKEIRIPQDFPFDDNFEMAHVGEWTAARQRRTQVPLYVEVTRIEAVEEEKAGEQTMEESDRGVRCVNSSLFSSYYSLWFCILLLSKNF